MPEILEVGDDREDGGVIVHIDEIEAYAGMEGVDEHDGRTGLDKSGDIRLVELRPQDDDARDRRVIDRSKDLLGGESLVGAHLESPAASLGFALKTIDIIRDENIVAGIDDMPMLSDSKEPNRPSLYGGIRFGRKRFVV